MEENLVNMAKSGNKEAFENLVNMYQKKLYIIAQSRIEKEEDIKDVIQDTLLQAYINIDSIKKSTSFNGWITQILLNNCSSIFRGNKRVVYSYEELKNETCAATEDKFNAIESTTDVFSIVERLPEQDKTLLMMHFSDGYTTKEISKMLNINESTVRTKIRRYRKKIKEEYDEEYYDII